MSVKECRDCGQVKPKSEFTKRKASKDGLALYCRKCFGLRNAESKRKRLVNEGKEPTPYRPRRVVPEGMKYCPRCQEVKSVQEFGRNRSKSSGLTAYCRPCHSVTMAECKRRLYGSQRSYLLKLRYGLTAEQVEECWQSQGGVCVICLRKKASHVDHSHETGLFRALLCFPCNGALGQYDDDPGRMREAAKYLEGRSHHAESMLLELGVAVIEGHARRLAFTGRLVDKDGVPIRRLGTSRDDRLRTRYGVGEKEIEELLAIQRGVCAICCDKPAENVDHDHVTGVVRGMLCDGCNSGMGQLRDDPVALRRAADYVQGALVRTVPADDGGVRLSFTFPDVDPVTVPVDGWESYRELDGEHRKQSLEFEDRKFEVTRLRLAEGGPGYCRRWAYGPRRPSFSERMAALVRSHPEHFAKKFSEASAGV
ncbi:endonuclease domain-containing protein [Spirillospora sp. CA-255316]